LGQSDPFYRSTYGCLGDAQRLRYFGLFPALHNVLIGRLLGLAIAHPCQQRQLFKSIRLHGLPLDQINNVKINPYGMALGHHIGKNGLVPGLNIVNIPCLA
jgi:hypothetical protein